MRVRLIATIKRNVKSRDRNQLARIDESRRIYFKRARNARNKCPDRSDRQRSVARAISPVLQLAESLRQSRIPFSSLENKRIHRDDDVFLSARRLRLDIVRADWIDGAVSFGDSDPPYSLALASKTHCWPSTLLLVSMSVHLISPPARSHAAGERLARLEGAPLRSGRSTYRNM